MTSRAAMTTFSSAVRFTAVLLLATFPVARAAAVPELPVFFGEEGGNVWIEVGPVGQEVGFRLLGPQGGRAGIQLLFPDVPLETDRRVHAGLEHLGSFRMEPTAGGRGTIVSLPFPLTSLTSVDRVLPGGWRFTFAVSESPATAPTDTGEYHVGVRDVLDITVFGHEDLSKVVEVPASGVYDFPLIREIQLAGRTVDDIQAELTRRLGEDYLVDPNVGVRVTDYQSQWVNIIGQVQKPGKYYLKGHSTLIDMLTEAGGLGDAAGTDIVVTQAEAGQIRQIHVNRADLFSEDNEASNLILRMGDVVEVEEQARFYIQGEVARPGSYPLERGYTLLKAITIAGGFSQWADRKQVELLREENGQRQKLKLNLKAIGARKEPDVELRADDIIIVKRRLL